MLSSIDLWKAVLSVLEGKILPEELREIRNAIIKAIGLASLT